MKAMLLAAGKGERLGTLTASCPKPMLLVAGKPILEHNLLLLREHGVREVVINLHHLPQVITQYFADGSRWGMRIHYSVEEALLGTAGAVKRAEEHFGETFLVLYGDNLGRCDLTGLSRFHRERGALATIAVYPTDNPCAGGILELDAQGQVRRFVEKPPPEAVFSDLANAGVYALEPEALAYIPVDRPSDFGRDVFPLLLQQGQPIYAYPTCPIAVVDTPELYHLACADPDLEVRRP